jgi:uncharacterized protein YdeI (YjbR/CyaY-like superfamily)
MPKTDPRFDAYIARAAPFARPILTHLRALVHQAVPDVEETMKWSSPQFMYHGMFCSMAAFKQHCVFGFWNRAFDLPASPEAAGHFGRITSLADLPSDRVMLGHLKRAAKMNEQGVKSPRTPKHSKTPLTVPADLQALLKKDRKAGSIFEKMSPSHQREYLEWIDEARREDTRTRRLETMIAQLREGKAKNWKYQ